MPTSSSPTNRLGEGVKALKGTIKPQFIQNLVRITWNYGGNEVYIIGSFTNWDYMIKMHKNVIGVTPVFEISMYMREGMYYYYFIVDGKVRFAPDQPSTIHKSQKIVNFMEIDRYMI